MLSAYLFFFSERWFTHLVLASVTGPNYPPSPEMARPGRKDNNSNQRRTQGGGNGAMPPDTPKRGGATCLAPPYTGWPFSGKSDPLGPIGQKNPNLAKLAHDNTLLGPFLFQREIFHSEKAPFGSPRTVFGLESSLLSPIGPSGIEWAFLAPKGLFLL